MHFHFSRCRVVVRTNGNRTRLLRRKTKGILKRYGIFNELLNIQITDKGGPLTFEDPLLSIKIDKTNEKCQGFTDL